MPNTYCLRTTTEYDRLMDLVPGLLPARENIADFLVTAIREQKLWPLGAYVSKASHTRNNPQTSDFLQRP